ncbi:hypothetical protein GZ77_15940 [Endozoicomonas montiporae]|uniref:SprT-like domain-containing protein n=1 Tax=Endozoicomonas montiporae TaxID=1027273 RepID=A0A081N5Q4_9GAMM|nr:hypothetical protein GZ77_15940 [Endozoicomonas montiporae]
MQLRIAELYCLAERHFVKRFKRPAILLNLRGETAGQAWPERNQLRLNRVLLEENQQHFLKHTLGHEVAHLIADQVFGRKIRPHGREWTFIMEQVFNLPAKRTHSYDTSQAAKRPFAYICKCPDKVIHLSAIRHNRALRGTVYQCASCKEPLKLKSQ